MMPLRPANIATNTGAGSVTLPDPPAARGDHTPARVPDISRPAPTIPLVVTPAELLAHNRTHGCEPAKSGPAGE